MGVWNIKNDFRCNRLGLRYNTHIFDGNGFPTSGPTGTGVNSRTSIGVDPGSIYIDYNTGQQFKNHGTAASPYWYPVGDVGGRHIAGVSTDFAGVATTDGTSTAAFYYATNGVRHFGQGIEVNDADTAQTVSYPIGGPLLTSGCTNEANHVDALGYGGTAGLWSPATNGPMVIEANFTGITDILTRSFFLGFSGDADGAMANEIDPVVTGATVTLTFSAVGTAGDNCAGLYMDSRMTAASTVFCVNNKANAAATQTATSAALTTAATVAAAATYNRWRVEIDASGHLRAFVNKVQVKYVASALGTSLPVCPIFYMSNTTTTASLQMGVREFHCYAKRA